ncbi:MAG TPA: alpha/beta hydrolase [Dehalococcoidia bacterium]
MPFVEASGAKIYYELHGEGPPLLLVPGFGCTVEIYFAQTPVLSMHFRTIVFDPRGAGRSDTPADGYSMQVYADDCVAVLHDAGFDSAHVLGTSFGGMVAQNLAVRHPDAVRRLILGCTTPGGAHHVLPPPENLATFLAALDVDDPAAATRMRYPLHYSDTYIAQHDDEIVARSIDTAALRSSPVGLAGQLAAVNGHDTFDGLPSIPAPTLVTHGDLDGVVPVENGRILARRIPNARLVLYEGAKHMFFVERAAEFNRDIIEFLEENER